MTETLVHIKNLHTQIKKQDIHQGLNLEIKAGEILGVIGASGSGKTILLKTILGLLPPKRGEIRVFGLDPYKPKFRKEIHARCGVLFQNGALFSSLTVQQNLQVPLWELAAYLPPYITQALADQKLNAVGLKSEVGLKIPSELSGGMAKRAALARALMMDAELLFLDEPTAGLDPIAADNFDTLILSLKESLQLTVFMVTHDLDTLYAVCDRVAVLVDKHIILGTIQELEQNPHPWVQEYFKRRRKRR